MQTCLHVCLVKSMLVKKHVDHTLSFLIHTLFNKPIFVLVLLDTPSSLFAT